jgi:hypothetical protein
MTLLHPMCPPPRATTRRNFLAQTAAVAGGGALALTALSPAVAGPVPNAAASPVTGDPDPIFAALDAHKAARVAVNAVIREVAALEGQLADRGITLSERKSDPQLEALEAALEVAFDAENYAACELVGMAAPTTMAGILALLQYANAADVDGEGWPADLESDDSSKSRSWHYFLIELLAEVLPDIMKGGGADTVQS